MTGFMHYDALQCVIFSAFDLLLWTKHSIHGLFFKCSNPKKISFNLNNSIMDTESFRCKKIIIEAITQVANYEDFLQHYLAADNVYADSEFCDSNVFD